MILVCLGVEACHDAPHTRLVNEVGFGLCGIEIDALHSPQSILILLPHDYDPPHICLHLDGGAPGGGDQRQRGDAAQEARGG